MKTTTIDKKGDKKEDSTTAMCSCCELDTAGNHESDCPCNPKRVIMDWNIMEE